MIFQDFDTSDTYGHKWEQEELFNYFKCQIDNSINFGWKPEDISVSICTSDQGLENFSVIIEQLSLEILFTKDLLVISPAMIDKARQLGFKSDIILADGASNLELLAALKDYQHGTSV